MPKDQKVLDSSPSIAKVIQYFSENYEFRKNIVTNDLEYRKIGEYNFKEVNENTLYIELRVGAGIKAALTDVMVFLGSAYIQELDPASDYIDRIRDVYTPDIHGADIEPRACLVRACEQRRLYIQSKKWWV